MPKVYRKVKKKKQSIAAPVFISIIGVLAICLSIKSNQVKSVIPEHGKKEVVFTEEVQLAERKAKNGEVYLKVRDGETTQDLINRAKPVELKSTPQQKAKKPSTVRLPNGKTVAANSKEGLDFSYDQKFLVADVYGN